MRNSASIVYYFHDEVCFFHDFSLFHVVKSMTFVKKRKYVYNLILVMSGEIVSGKI